MFESLKDEKPSENNSQVPDVAGLSDMEKIELCYAWKVKGVGVTTLSKIFKVTRRTIYNWLNKYRDEYLMSLEESKPVEILVEHDAMLQHLEDVALYELNRLSTPEFQMDENEQVHKKSRTGSIKELSELIKTAAGIRQQRINLHTLVGIIPKKAEELHVAVSSRTAADSAEEYQLSSEELRDALLAKLQKNVRL
jgi:transposase